MLIWGSWRVVWGAGWGWALVGSQTGEGEKRQGKETEVILALRVVDSEEENGDKAEFDLPLFRSGISGREGRDPCLELKLRSGYFEGET